MPRKMETTVDPIQFGLADVLTSKTPDMISKFGREAYTFTDTATPSTVRGTNDTEGQKDDE